MGFTGVDTLVLVSAGTAEDDVVIRRHDNAIRAAEHDGVGHIVYTSPLMVANTSDSPSPIGGLSADFEKESYRGRSCAMVCMPS